MQIERRYHNLIGGTHTFQYSDNDSERDKLPFTADPNMEEGTYSPHRHHTRDPSTHTELSTSCCADWLHRDEEYKEPSHGRIEIFGLETRVACEVGGFRIANV